MSFLVCSYILSFILICQRPVVFGKTCGSCTRMTFSVKDVLNDRALEDNRRLKDTIVEHDSQCFSQCSHNCQCLSFNICGKTCQLNAANKFLAKNSLRVKPGCRYYDFPISESSCEAQSSGPPGICCSRLSTPCFNGGSCAVNISDTNRRFACKCPPGFYGDQCEVKQPKTCLDYWVGPVKPRSREYTIEDLSGNPYKVFCDFDSEEGIAWTLIESFSLSNVGSFSSYSFTINHPLNENNLNWNLFRLSKATMSDIKSSSTFWRGTCSYPTYGVDFRDYVRVRLSSVDPTVFVGGSACNQADFLDIKGESCVNCTTVFYQNDQANGMLHVGHYWGRQFGCSFDSINIEYQCSGSEERARFLGLYSLCSDPALRCTETSSSTTQIWFGGQKS